MPPRVLLVNGWSDDNKGDCAIVQGLLRLIASQAPGADVAIVSSFDLSHEERGAHYRFTARSQGNVTFDNPLLAASRLQGQPRPSLVQRLWALLSSILLLATAPILASGLGRWLMVPAKRDAFERVSHADVIISKGGHIFVSNGTYSGLLGLYQYLFPLILGIRLRKRVVLYGQSLGPVPDRLGRMLLRAVLRRCDRVLVREEMSGAFARELMPGSEERVRLCWDTAFAVERERLPEACQNQLPTEFVAMTVRQWEFPGSSSEIARERYRAYLNAVAGAINYLWHTHQLPVVLAPQVIGPSRLENDYLAWDQLIPLLTDRRAIVALKADLSPGQLMDLYGKARILLGTRFHSVILGLAAGTPSAAISYYGYKTRGIMRMLDLEALVFDIGSLSQVELERAVDELLEHENMYRRLIDRQRSLIIQESLRAASEVLVSTRRDSERSGTSATRPGIALAP